jgi:hypothetical protein
MVYEFDLTKVSDIERLYVATCFLVPIDEEERRLFVRDTTGKLFTRHAVSRIQSFLHVSELFRHGSSEIACDEAVLSQIFDENFFVFSYEEDMYHRMPLQETFRMMISGGGPPITAETYEKVDALLFSLHVDQGHLFPEFKSGTLTFVFESEDLPEDHIPGVLFFAERLLHLLLVESNDECAVDFESWNEATKKSMTEERQAYLLFEDKKIIEWIEPAADPVNACFRNRHIIPDVTTLYAAMYTLLPHNDLDKAATRAHAEKQNDGSVMKLSLFQIEREEAHDFHRALIFCELFHQKFQFFDVVHAYLEEGKQKYRLRTKYYLTIKERQALEQRYKNAWSEKIMAQKIPGVPLTGKEPSSEPSVKDRLQSLIKDGKIEGPDIICLTPTTPEERKAWKERLKKNTRYLRDNPLNKAKAEPTTPPPEIEEEETGNTSGVPPPPPPPITPEPGLVMLEGDESAPVRSGKLLI